MLLKPTLTQGRHPLYRSFGANLPTSLSRVILVTPEPSKLGAPVSVLGTDTQDPKRLLFHGLRGLPEPSYDGHSLLKLFLTVTVLHSHVQLRRSDSCAQATLKSQKDALTVARYLCGAGILTSFPFTLPV